MNKGLETDQGTVQHLTARSVVNCRSKLYIHTHISIHNHYIYYIIVSTCVGDNELLNIVSKGCKSNNFTCMSQKLLKLEEYCCCQLHIPSIIKSKRL